MLFMKQNSKKAPNDNQIEIIQIKPKPLICNDYQLSHKKNKYQNNQGQPVTKQPLSKMA